MSVAAAVKLPSAETTDCRIIHVNNLSVQFDHFQFDHFHKDRKAVSTSMTAARQKSGHDRTAETHLNNDYKPAHLFIFVAGPKNFLSNIKKISEKKNGLIT